MTVPENNTAVSVIDNDQFIELSKKAPEVLAENKTSHEKAIAYGNTLLEKANAGMNDELDKLLSGYLDKVRTTVKTMNERRKPFTQIIALVTKQFTTLEGDLDPSGKDNIYFRIQTKRDQYATEKMRIQKQKEQDQQKALAKLNEAVAISRHYEVQLASKLSDIKDSYKRQLAAVFDTLQLTNDPVIDFMYYAKNSIEAKHSELCLFTWEMFFVIEVPAFSALYHNSDEVGAMKHVAFSELVYMEFYKELKFAIDAAKYDLLDKLPSKKAELQELANANAEEAKRIQDDIDERKRQDDIRLQQEKESELIASTQQADTKAAGASMEAMVNTQVDMFQEAPKIKESYEIQVKSVSGNALLFQFWFDKEGKTWTQDKIEKMTIGRMKAFCEAWAVKNEELIQSSLIHYEPKYKAK